MLAIDAVLVGGVAVGLEGRDEGLEAGREDNEVVGTWRGDVGLPFVGRSPKYDNLTVAAGHAMIGLSLSSITGVLVLQIIMDEKPSIERALLRMDRFD